MQLISNHDYLKRFYRQMQVKLEEKKTLIVEERVAWEKEKHEI